MDFSPPDRIITESQIQAEMRRLEDDVFEVDRGAFCRLHQELEAWRGDRSNRNIIQKEYVKGVYHTMDRFSLDFRGQNVYLFEVKRRKALNDAKVVKICFLACMYGALLFLVVLFAYLVTNHGIG